MTALTHRFVQAVDYARIAHAAQFRKGSQIPYIYHLLGVSSLVLEYGGSEDQAIAGLLHDVLEDCGAAHESAIRAQFGDTVAMIVRDCTDGMAESKAAPKSDAEKFANWVERKLVYIAHIATEDQESLLVSACDKLHNARSILADLRQLGDALWKRFNASKAQSLWYYRSLVEAFAAHGKYPLVDELARGLELDDAQDDHHD